MNSSEDELLVCAKKLELWLMNMLAHHHYDHIEVLFDLLPYELLSQDELLVCEKKLELWLMNMLAHHHYDHIEVLFDSPAI